MGSSANCGLLAEGEHLWIGSAKNNLISNKAPQHSKALERIAGVASLSLVHGNDFVADLRVQRFQVGSAERCC